MVRRPMTGPQHRRRCGLDENGCRLVNGEAAQSGDGTEIAGLETIQVGGDPYVLVGDFKFKHCSLFSTVFW